ncbi:MAG: bifunctional diguanylate cyclase/phosphodiesterase [Pseudoxanthomonas sp.]
METTTPAAAASPRPPGRDDERRLQGMPPLAWAVALLVIGFLFTAWVARREWRDARQRANAAYQVAADHGVQRLEAQLASAATLLRAVQTVFLANDHMDQAQFSQYNENLRLHARLPGHVATAFARRQADPADPGRIAYVYQLTAPARGNESLLGFNMIRQKENLLALQRARDADAATVSEPFPLRQRSADGKPLMGITMRLPVYSRGSIPDSVETRRAREIGALAVSLRLDALVRDGLPAQALEQFRVRIRDMDGASAAAFFDSGTATATGAPTYLRTLAFGGRRWQLQLQPRPAPLDTGRLRTVVVAGVTISSLLALLLWSLATTRRRAIVLGSRMSTRFGESEARFRTLNELLPALVLLADGHDGRIVYANQAARLRLGDAGGRTMASLFEDPLLKQNVADLDGVDRGWNSVEAELASPGSRSFWVNSSIAQVEMEGKSHLLMVATDISEQRELTERLSYQATHDALTELCNRREFERRVEQALAERKARPEALSCALLYFDLDQFKLINDLSGHMAGDQLLAQLALTMRQWSRPGDVLARLGGDEFGLLAFDVDAGAALALANDLRERIEAQMFTWQEHTYTISASIGVVMVDHGDPTLKNLLAWADTACYLAKENGRNRVHVYREDDETTRRLGEMEWANRLRSAMEQDRLLLDYQEIVPLGPLPAHAPSLELLLRLRDEEGGIVLPGTFLPAAERYGMMPLIDRWVIRTALAHFHELHPAGARLGLCAINLSGASVEDPALADFILACADEFRVPAQSLCFEITETVAVRSLLKVVHVIERLREAGCLIALDDFGAGMSSFGYLKNLPVDIIKIDGSFIRDLGIDPMSRTIVSAIAQIGHQRGLKVVAEWVNGSHISAALSLLGVDYGQGYALHRPERVLFQRPGPERRHAIGS